MTYFTGIDNSSLDHKIHILDGDGKLHSHFTIDNNLNGFMKLHESLQVLPDVRIGFELPHGPLVDFLHEKEYQLYSLNPLKIKRFKETITVSGNKNDYIDVAAIGEYLRKNKSHCRPMLFNSPGIEKLKTLSIIHSRITKEHSRYKNKLHFVLRQYFNLHDTLFTNLGCIIQIKMLKKYPTFGLLREASESEITDFLIQNNYRVKKNLNRVLKAIREYDQLIPAETESAYFIEALLLCDMIFSLKENLKKVEKEMENIVKKHPLGKVFRSLPGAGKILSSKLLASFGDNKNRFRAANEIQCLFGTAPRNYQSGSYHKVIMRTACNKIGRVVLFKYAFESLRFSGWARAYYDEQKKKGKTHSVAVRALSNKWVKIIFRMWKDEIIYQENEKIDTAA